MTTNDTALSLVDTVVVLGGFPALAGASFEVREGELVALRGANGSGKSTLLRACAGLVPVARGTLRVLGVDLGARSTTNSSTMRRHVGLLGHKNGLYADLTARENVEFAARLVGASDNDVDEALTRLGIDARVSATRAVSLSAGQRRRTALASLVVRRARLWLLDEPHAGLDSAARIELDAILRDATRAGATVVYTTHEVANAAALNTALNTVSNTVSNATIVPRTITLAGGVVASDVPGGGAR